MLALLACLYCKLRLGDDLQLLIFAGPGAWGGLLDGFDGSV